MKKRQRDSKGKQSIAKPCSTLAQPTHGITRWSGIAKNGCSWEILRSDAKTALASMENERFRCVVTSPPYYSQRDYEVDGQIGLEKTIAEYVSRIVDTFDEVKRVLARDGCLFLNLGDTYYSGKGQPRGKDRKNGARRFGLRPVDASGLGVARKTTIGIPWRVALAMIERGWTLRCPIVWLRNGTPPEPTARDRPWKTYEMVFLFVKEPRYFFQRSGLNGEEDVWRISNRPKHSRGVHSAAFPDELVQRCLKVGCPPNGEVLDPFAGSGTVMRVALASGRPAVAIDLSEKYCKHMAQGVEQL
ncbi:MAG: site-specific DNA-methyltransferase [Planctomycetota bacterium]|nr:MAG: site-specific DNA-methyltransferase [Planctomycetota bacterium]